MSKPFFSIIIPTYNRASFILNTIDSILKQSFQDFEIIVIDDGSTDNTETLIKTKFPKNNKIKYFYQENSERGAARNNGFKKASGKYIIFFDSDDWMYPNHLTTLYKTILINPDVRFLTTKFSFQENETIKTSSSHDLTEGWHSGDVYLKGGITGIMICILKNNPALKPFVEDRIYATLEDWMYLVQNIVHDKIFVINKVTILVNDHPSRSMRADNVQIINKRLLATKWIKENVYLTEEQIRILNGYSDFFCAVHSYADNHKRDAIKYLINSVKKTGLSIASLKLFIKILLGYNFIQRLK